MDEIEPYIRSSFAGNAGITQEQLDAEGVTLADVISLSPRMTNSIDLMEAFAKTANSVRHDYGVRVRIGALPLDTPIPEVLKAFLEEFDRQREATRQ